VHLTGLENEQPTLMKRQTGSSNCARSRRSYRRGKPQALNAICQIVAVFARGAFIYDVVGKNLGLVATFFGVR
jgi:hypothetical protein